LSETQHILLTGASGYIGSHTWVELIQSGYKVIGIDNFCNSSNKVLERIEKIVDQKIHFYQGDIRDSLLLKKIFQSHQISGVIHFAALKAVGDSVKNPLEYYANNLDALICLLGVMQELNVNKFVFSSSATVYGDPEYVPIDELAKLKPTNPYGQTKLIGEQILRDFERANPDFRVAYLSLD
jgi:UDP-glucose 4-epimerase